MRDRLANVLHRTGILDGAMKLRRFSNPTLSIITYHHIEEQDPRYPYDPEVADAGPGQFRRQMQLLAKYCTPIGLDDLIKSIHGEPIPQNAVMVTFDDGYRSCHDMALPILRSEGVRATFFVSTGYINDRLLYWWERIALIVSQSRKPTATITYPSVLQLDRKDPKLRRTLTALVKNTAGLDIERFLRELGTAFEVDWSTALERKYADGLIMTWDHLRGLVGAGMDVESHGRRHRVLQTLDDASLEDELAGSRRDLETHLGRKVRAVAYPVGRSITREQRIRRAIRSAGYTVGLTNATGVNRVVDPGTRKLRIDPLDVRRIATGRQMSDSMFLMQLAIPQLAYINR